jgi:hypothetical protein
MFAEELTVGVEEIGVGGLQGPGELRAIGFAGVDLIALGVQGKEELFPGGRLELPGDLLRGGRGTKNGAGDEKCEESECAEHGAHGTSPPKTIGGIAAEENITQVSEKSGEELQDAK